MPGSLADLVVHLREGILAAELLPQLMVQGAIKHLPELLAVHVAVSVQHLEPVEQRWVVRTWGGDGSGAGNA